MNRLNRIKGMTQMIQSINSILMLTFWEIFYFVYPVFWKTFNFVDIFGKRLISLTFWESFDFVDAYWDVLKQFK